MKIEYLEEEIKITIPKDFIGMEEIQRLFDYYKFKEIVSKSKATEDDVNEISNEINKSWWDKNKHRFVEDETNN